MRLAQPSKGTLSTKATPVNPSPALVRVALIGCSKKKLDGTHPARNLYQGALFKKALAHAMRTADEVFILSAFHGLVPLDKQLDAYDRPLAGQSKSERAGWAYRVCLDLRQRMRGRRYRLTIFAGEAYADAVARYLAQLDETIEVTTPLAGLSLGYQLRWFDMAAQLSGGAR